jgi:hypothetical protein
MWMAGSSPAMTRHKLAKGFALDIPAVSARTG